MLKKYNGKLGTFEYDDNLYNVIQDEDGEYCHYIGSDMDNVTPPVGLKDYTGLYMGTNITKPVVIENGVISTNSMYADCKQLKEGSIIPDSVIDMSFMYDGCSNLESIPNFSKNAVNLSATCANCSSLKTLPPIPGSAKQCDSIALNCESLTGPIEIGYGVEDISCGFAGCSSLESSIELPSSILKSEDVFENCMMLDNIENTMELDSSNFVEAYVDESKLESRTLSTESKQAMAAAIAPDMLTDNYEATVSK